MVVVEHMCNNSSQPYPIVTTIVFIGPCPWFSLLLAWPMPQDAPRQGRPRVGEHEPTTKTEPAADRKKDLHHQMPVRYL